MPQRVSVFPFYRTDFCSALHQEMQGYIRVSPKGADVPLKWNSPSFPAVAAAHGTGGTTGGK